ncbi:ubiquinone biosynthesis protein UbiB [Candidatus Pelagibacter sp.]|nr:ubiquinone biosynthesis protein UbiB [Candidatus Pelagibacter sp.]
MKVCILGNGLVSLTLAKSLVNLGINVDIFSDQKIKKYNKIQTIGISKNNIEFFNSNILNIKKLLWDINNIEIFSENLKNQRILKFDDKNNRLFSIIKNFQIYSLLHSKLKKDNLVKFKKSFKKNILTNNEYKLIFNCEYNHSITEKFFNKRINKNYNSLAYITLIKHNKLESNDIATQIFTKIGPIAFLPVSLTETSVVYSIKEKQNINLEKLIRQYNKKYKILKIAKPENFKLKLSILRNYYHNNIIAFGELLHKIHPLAGQGFNMSIRDIKEIIKLIKFKINHGLDLDNSICKDFERKTRHKNYFFSNSIDFIYEYFNYENKINNNILSKTVRYIGNSKVVNKYFKELADNGINL